MHEPSRVQGREYAGYERRELILVMMKENAKAEALRLAIKAAGGVRALARRLGVHPSTVDGWNKVGQIPAHRVLQVEAEIGIQRELLRPDLYRRDDNVCAERSS